MALRRRLKPKENKVMKKYVDTGEVTNIRTWDDVFGTIITNESKAQVLSNMMRGGNLKSLLREELLKQGYDLAAIARDLIDLRNAKKTIYATEKGKITDTMELQDNTTKLNTVNLITKIIGIQDSVVVPGINPNSFQDMDTEELRRMVELAGSVDAEYEEV
jgi:hypothetical protein